MAWRKIVAGLLAALVLLASALPAMCENCPKVTAADACATEHRPVAAEDHSADSMIAADAKCKVCADASHPDSKESDVEQAALASLPAPGALHHCVELVTQNLLMARQYVATHRNVIYLSDAGASPHAAFVRIHAMQSRTSAPSNKLSVNFPTPAGLAVLKI